MIQNIIIAIVPILVTIEAAVDTNHTASANFSLSQIANASTTGMFMLTNSTTQASGTAFSQNTSMSSPRWSNSTTSAPGGMNASKAFRGVNIGGWLVLEKWMTPEIFDGLDAADQYTFDQTEGAREKLHEHWETFFTEADVRRLATYGINALRIPVGYWAFNAFNQSYIQGAEAYLDRAIMWARRLHMSVLIDLHGVPGSQNGEVSSGQAGDVGWQRPQNLQRSLETISKMALRYGGLDYQDVVLGIGILNEPTGDNLDITQDWVRWAYKAIVNAAANKNLKVVMHDAFAGPENWLSTNKAVSRDDSVDSKARFVLDMHQYQLFEDDENTLTQEQHIAKACSWSSELSATRKLNLPTLVGEWSASTNICVNTDNSTTPGTTCSNQGCQCQSIDPMDTWTPAMIEQTRRYVEAQLDVFEKTSMGYFVWSYKAPGAWGFRNGIEKGVFPNPLSHRRYPGQCEI